MLHHFARARLPTKRVFQPFCPPRAWPARSKRRQTTPNRRALTQIIKALASGRITLVPKPPNQVTTVARRVVGENHDLTLTMRWIYATALYHDTGATLDGLREAVTTLEEIERTARCVLGGAHPTTKGIEDELQDARDALYARGLP